MRTPSMIASNVATERALQILQIVASAEGDRIRSDGLLLLGPGVRPGPGVVSGPYSRLTDDPEKRPLPGTHFSTRSFLEVE